MTEAIEYFISSDWHLGHDKMQQLCGRPNDFEAQLHDQLALRFQSGSPLSALDLKSNRVFINLGDVVLRSSGSERLKWMLQTVKTYCRLAILVRGNHDPSIAKCYTQGWDFVCDRLDLWIYGKHFAFQHTPDAGLADDEILIHGHQHNTVHRGLYQNDGKKILISSEYLDYRLITLEQIHKIGRTPMWKDGKFADLDKAAIQAHKEICEPEIL